MNRELRPLRWTDIRTAYRLACDPDERREARDHSLPTFRGHLRWMWRWVGGGDYLAWVILDQGKPAGLVRAESSFTTWRLWVVDADVPLREQEMSIVLFPAFRGKRLASWAIREAAEKLDTRDGSITAYIRKGNRASMGAFRKAGFRFTGRVIEGLSQFVYGED